MDNNRIVYIFVANYIFTRYWVAAFCNTIGTGFFVNPNGDVVTAFHVVDGFRGKDGTDHPGARQFIEDLTAAGINAKIFVSVSLPNIDEKALGKHNELKITMGGVSADFEVDVMSTDPAHDLALIRPHNNPFTHMPKLFEFPGSKSEDLPQAKAKFVTFSAKRPRDAEDIFACGYAFGEPSQITTSGTLASGWNSEVLLRAEAAGFPLPAEVYEVDLRINPGNSGGPVFRLSDQSVIGVAVQSHGSLGVVIPAKFVTAFLTSQGVAWTPVKIVSSGSKTPR